MSPALPEPAPHPEAARALPAPPSSAPEPPSDPIRRFIAFPTLKRLLRLSIFCGLLFYFRHLLVLFVVFVAFERTMSALAALLTRHAGVPRKAAVGLVALTLLGAFGTAIALGAGSAFHAGLSFKGSLPDRIAAVRETDMFRQIQDRLGDTDKLVDGAQHYARGALEYLAAVGHFLIFGLIGFILAVVYLIEKDELDEFAASQPPRSLAGTLLRWFSHVADAISVTLQFQVVVAAINAVLTFPVLLVVGIPHATSFLFMVFFSGMVPVVGNFIAGAVLTLLAFQAKGWLGVGLFAGLTFVLHKLESYYLNPRLASRHVKLPGFVLIVSLLLWEQIAGFAGLFISFPFLFVANRIRAELREEDRALAAEARPRLPSHG